MVQGAVTPNSIAVNISSSYNGCPVRLDVTSQLVTQLVNDAVIGKHE